MITIGNMICMITMISYQMSVAEWSKVEAHKAWETKGRLDGRLTARAVSEKHSISHECIL